MIPAPHHRQFPPPGLSVVVELVIVVLGVFIGLQTSSWLHQQPAAEFKR